VANEHGRPGHSLHEVRHAVEHLVGFASARAVIDEEDRFHAAGTQARLKDGGLHRLSHNIGVPRCRVPRCRVPGALPGAGAGCRAVSYRLDSFGATC
jgi:hypothetical protein